MINQKYIKYKNTKRTDEILINILSKYNLSYDIAYSVEETTIIIKGVINYSIIINLLEELKNCAKYEWKTILKLDCEIKY